MSVSTSCACAHNGVATLAACILEAQLTAHSAFPEQVVVVLAVIGLSATDSAARVKRLLGGLVFVCLVTAGFAARC